jgi:hypothetical protein
MSRAHTFKHGDDDGAGHVGHGGHGGDDAGGGHGGGHGGGKGGKGRGGADDGVNHQSKTVGMLSHGGDDDDNGGGHGGGGGGGDRIRGTDGADTLTGTSGDDRIEGLGGDDIIDGGAGSDRIEAGDGNDTVTSLHAEETDKLDVRIDLGDGNDTLDFSGGDRTRGRISDGAGDDLIRIDGGSRVDVKNGAGADTIKLDAGATFATDFRVDKFVAGDAGDKLDLSGFLSTALSNWDGVADPFSDGHLQLVQTAEGAVLQIDADGGADGFVDLVELHNVQADALTAFNFSGLTPVVNGDGFSGGGGDDDADGGHGGDDMGGHGGNDDLHGHGGDDTVDGGSGDDNCSGGGGDDSVTGGDGDDNMTGGGGDDTLNGGGGDDHLSGGGGDDDFVFGPDAADGSTDTITGFEPGKDVIDLSAIDADPVTDADQAFTFVDAFTNQAGQATLSYDAGTDQTTAAFDVDGDGVSDLTLLISGEVTADSGWVL